MPWQKAHARANPRVVFLYAGSAIYIYEATTMAGSSCEDISISGGHCRGVAKEGA